MPLGRTDMHQITRAAFLYDYIVPNVRGIRGCELPCAVEDKFMWARTPIERLNKLKLNLNSAETLQYAASNKAFYVTDILDGCLRVKEYESLFPGCQIMHIVRNGFDVIGARQVMHWDNWYGYAYPSGPSADWLSGNKPWFAEESWDNRWNQVTKIAHLWRIQVDSLPPTIWYERMMGNPKEWVQILMGLSPVLERTVATDAIIDHMVSVHGNRPVSSVTIRDIQEPEKSKFINAMERLGYEIK